MSATGMPLESKAAEVLSELMGDPAIGMAFPALLRGLTDKRDVRNVESMCKIIVGEETEDAWKKLFKLFYDEVLDARATMPERILAREAQLPQDWFQEPWYLLYVQLTGCAEYDSDGGATFDDLRCMLSYIRDDLGFNNVCLLPHYESPMADGGYDVSAYVTRESLGGEEAFVRFMDDALDMGIRVATDAVFNHTSTEHEWFQKALAGEEEYIAYYVQRNGREKIAEWDRDGDIVCRYRDPDGTITERVVVFPDIDRTHGLWAEISGKTYQFYRGFFPFQVDLNLQNPNVLGELFKVLSREVKQGVLGKRMDAIAHWIKQPGCAAEGLPECHAVQALLKSFLRHIGSRCALIPEVVRNVENVAEYAGVETAVNGEPCPSEGDALLAFEMQGALREMTYFQMVAPFWHCVFRSPDLPKGAVWMNCLEHHDETYMGFFVPEVRRWIADYIKTHGGVVYKNGMSAGGRYADCLDHNTERISTALFLLFMCPGTPLVYSGTEVGARNNLDYAKYQMEKSHAIYEKLGVYAAESACFDPRELQRGPLPKKVFSDAVAESYGPTETLRRMNELRKRRRSLRSAEVSPLDSGDVGLFCMGRHAEGDEPLLCVANLTPLEKEFAVPLRQAVRLFSIEDFPKENVADSSQSAFFDLMSCKKMEIKRDMASLKFKLKPFGRALVHVEEVDESTPT